MNEYEKQAQDFLDKTNTEFTATFNRHGKYFDDDKQARDIYNITLKRGGREYTFKFGQSVVNSGKKPNRKAPTAYDVLACITKYDPGTFEEFCGEFGYDTDSKKAEKTYKAVVQEWLTVSRLYNDEEIELMAEIA